MKAVLRLLAGLALFSFFLPWVKLTFFGMTFLGGQELSGFAALTGGQNQYGSSPPNPLVGLVFLATLASFGTSWIPRKNGFFLPALSATVSFLLLLLLLGATKSAGASPSEPAIGFYACILFTLGTAIVGYVGAAKSIQPASLSVADGKPPVSRHSTGNTLSWWTIAFAISGVWPLGIFGAAGAIAFGCLARRQLAAANIESGGPYVRATVGLILGWLLLLARLYLYTRLWK